MKIIICLLVCFMVSHVYSLCPVNSICTEPRDNIVQSDSSVTSLEKIKSRSRAWYIKPSQRPTNLILAFKNFTSSEYASVVVISQEPKHKNTTQYFYGDLGDFEVVLENTVGTIIYVPIQAMRTPNFALEYYTGCNVLQMSEYRIDFPMPGPLSTPGITSERGPIFCWVINPVSVNSRKRLYFSLRNVALAEGQSLTIWDVRTKNILAKMESNIDFRAVVVESDSGQPIMIEFACLQESCDLTETAFYINYYAMKEEDIQCIETQKYCSDSNYTIPQEICDVPCPKLNNMIMEEYEMDIGSNILSSFELAEDNQIVLRSGNYIRKKSDRKRIPCPIHEKFCKCPKNTNLRKFCGKTQCFKQKGCTVACIFAQFFVCQKTKVLKVGIKLL